MYVTPWYPANDNGSAMYQRAGQALDSGTISAYFGDLRPLQQANLMDPDMCNWWCV